MLPTNFKPPIFFLNDIVFEKYSPDVIKIIITVITPLKNNSSEKFWYAPTQIGVPMTFG